MALTAKLCKVTDMNGCHKGSKIMAIAKQLYRKPQQTEEVEEEG